MHNDYSPNYDYILFVLFYTSQLDNVPENCRPESLQWHHNERDGVSNHRRLDFLLSLLFRRTIKKTSKLRTTGLCEGNPPTGDWWFESPHKGPLTRKMFPFVDVIMVRATKPYSSVKLVSVFFQNDQHTVYLLNITFIFDRFRRSGDTCQISMCFN